MLKAFVPSLVSFYVFGQNYVMLYIAGLSSMLGHIYPVCYKFKGGKGIAATGGLVLSLLDWRIGLMFVLGMALPILITRYVSLGSLIGEALLFVAWLIWGRELMPTLAEAYFTEDWFNSMLTDTKQKVMLLTKFGKLS